MKLNLLLLLILLFVLGCQASGGGAGDVINHVATPTKFTLSTTLNKTYNSSQEIILTASFSQAVTVTGNPNLNLTIGAASKVASYFSGTGTNALIFKYTVSSGDLDTDGISVAANINLNGGTLIYDIDKACPLTMTLPSLVTVKVDTISPTLNSVSSPISTTYFAGQSLSFNAIFSENVVVTGSPRIAIDIGGTTRYATYLSGSGSSNLAFTYLVTSSDMDADGIEISSPLGLNAGTISDYGGNSSSLTFTPPVTTSVFVAGATPLIISVTPPANGTYNSSQNLDFTLTFNKVVNITGSPRLSLTLGSTSRDAVYLSGSGSTAIKFRYTVVGGDVDADGIALVNSVNLNGGTIRDASLNNAFLLFGAPNLTGVKVASSLPSITTISLPSSPPVNGYDVGQNIDFTVNFSEAVIETGGTSRLKMDIGGVTKYAVYTSGSGTTSLVYRYSVVLNDEDLNGVALLSPLELNGSTLANIGSFSAILTFTPPVTTSIKVDAKNPALISNTLPANGTYVAAQNLDFDVTYSEPVTVTGSPRIVIDIGGVTRYATYLSGTGTSILKFRYTVIGADADPNGIALTPAISLNAGTIKDPAGHNADLTLVSTTTTGILVGNNPPTISSVVLPANATYKTTQNVDISAVFSENVLVTGSPRLALTLGSGTVYADYVSGSGSSSLIFRYTVAADDFDVDGILLASPLDLNSGTIMSASVVAADLDFALPNSSGILIDGLDPVISSVMPPIDKTYILNENLDFTINYSLPVIVTGVPSLSLTIGSSTVSANYLSGSGTTALTFRYTAVSGDLDSNGILTASPLNLNAGTINDPFGDAASLSFTLPVTSGVLVDAVIPTITSVAGPTPGSYYLGNNLEFDVVTSKSITVTGSPRIALTVGAATKYATYLSGSGTSLLKFRYTVGSGDTDSDGIAVISPLGLNSGTLKDFAGNNLSPLTFTAPNTALVNVDGNGASIISLSAPANTTYSTGNNLNFTALFTQPVTVTGSPRVALTVGASTVYADYLSGSGTSSLVFRYTVVAGQSDGDGIAITAPVDLNGGTIKDAASNSALLTFTAPNTTAVLVDGIDIVISSITPPADKTYINAENLDFIVNFNYPAIVSGNPRIGLTVGASTFYATYLSGSGTAAHTYRYTVGATDADADGIDTLSNIDLNAGTIKDSFGDDAVVTFPGANYPNVKVDGIAPTISSVAPPSPGTYYVNGNLDFDVSTSDSITVTGSPRITLTVGAATRYATYLSGSGTSLLKFRYTVGSGDTDSDGIAVISPLDLNSGTLKDFAGNNLSPLTFTAPNTALVNVDGNGASIISLSAPANTTYSTGNNLNFTALFTQPVTVTGSPRVALTVGASTVYADYLSGSGTSSLVFRYTVVAGQSDGDGIAITAPVDLNGGTIKDAATNSALLTFTAPNTTAVLVDGIDIVISSITPPADKTYINAENLDFIVNFNYPATASGSPRIALTVGASTRYATYQSGSGTVAHTYRYTVGTNDLDTNGIDSLSNIDLNAGSIKDSFGDNATVTFAGANYPNVKVDGVAPTILSVTPPSAGTYYINANLDFDVSTSESITVTGSPRIPLTVGAATKYATYLSGSGTSLLKFRYTVGSGDTDSDGISVSSPMGLNSGTLKDVSGNDLSPLTFTSPNTALVNVDGNGASVISLTAPANSTYLTGNNLNFTALFTQPVTVTGTPRVALTVGATTLYADYLSGSGTSSLIFRYTVVAGQSDGDGIAITAQVDLNGGTIKDAATNAAALTFTAPNTTAVLVDGIDIVISSITPPADKTYINAENLDFIVNFNYPAIVSGNPRIGLTVGASTRYATYQSGSGTAAHTYRYTVGATDVDVNGIDSLSNIDLNAGTIKDSFGDNATVTFAGANYPNVKVDGVAPTIMSVAPPSPSTYYVNENLDFDVSTSESITVTGSPRIALTVGAATKYATYLSGSGTSLLKFSYTVGIGDTDSDGIDVASPLELNSGTLKDFAGNNLSPLTFTAPNTALVNVDGNSASVISLTAPANTTYSTGINLNFTALFTQPVTVTGTPRVALTVGASSVYADYVSGSGTSSLVFRYTVVAGQADSDGIAITTPIDLNAGTIKDAASNSALLTFTAPNTTAVLVDGIDIVISSITPPADKTYINAENLDFIVNFNYPAIVSGNPRIGLTVGASTFYATYLSGSGTAAHTYRYTVGATDADADGIDTLSNIDLNAGTIKDSFGDNAVVTFPGANYPNVKVDGVAPTILSVTPPSAGTYYINANLDFDVSTSESITVTGSPRIALTVGAATKYATYLSGSGTSLLKFRYTVGIGDTDSDGIAVISPLGLNSGTLKDFAGNNLSPLTFTAPNTALVNVDGNSASLISLTAPANATYSTGNNLNFTALFSQPVTVTGTPRVALTVGATTLYADYLSGSGTSSLVFRYTVVAGQADGDGIAITAPVDLNGGTIKDAATNAATLTFTAPNTTAVLVDGIDIVISSITPPTDKTYINAENLDFIVNFNYPATASGSPRIALTVGASTFYATYQSGSGTVAHTYRYTVGTNDLDTNGIDSLSNIDLNGGTIKDSFGDNATVTFAGANYPNLKVDGVAPTILSVTPPSAGTYYINANLDFDVSTSESITVTGSPRIALTVGAATKYATYLSGSGTSLLKFRYTVGNGDTDSDGISVSSPMGLNSGTLKDVSGNDLSPLTFTSPNTALVNVDGNGATIISLSAPANSTYLTGNNLNFTALFSQPVTVTGTPRVALTVGATTLYADYLSGSGTSSLIFRYTVVAGQSDGDGIAITAPIDLNGGTIKDAATNAAALTFTAPNTTAVLVDGIDIVISSITPPADKTYINAENLDFIVNFNYPATASGSPRIALTVGASTRYATYQSGSGTVAHTYRYTVGTNDLDTNGIDSLSNIDLNGGTIKDSFGDNATVTFAGANYPNLKVDAVIPTILSVSSPSPGTYYLDENLEFDVSFSESVVITGSPALSITIGSTTRLATYLSGSTSNTIKFRYKIVNGDIDTDGIALVSPAVLNAGTIKDTAGNNSTLTYTAPNTSGVKVDTSSVEIASIVVPSGKYNTGSFLDVTVNFARAVNVTGTPLIKTTVGSQTIFANYLSGSGTSSIIFRHIVAAGEIDADGINLVSPIMLNSGTIQDTSLQNAVLTYTAPDTSAVLVDGIDLEILSVTPPVDKIYLYNESIIFDVNYNYSAFVTGSPRIALTVGSSTSYAVYDSGSGTSVIRFKYIVGSSDLDSNGIDSISPLDLNSGTIKDSFADAASLVFTGGNLPNVKVDGSVPTISSVTAPTNGTYDTTNVLTFTATFSENITITGSPRIPLTIGSTTRYATYSAGSGTNSATFTYTLVASDSDMDGIAVISPLDLNAGTIVDLSGNLMTNLTFTPPVTTGVLVAGNVPDVAKSSITGTGPVVANGSSTSTITITLKNAADNGVVGITPTFSATNTGTTNVNSTCSVTDASGVSTCTLKSTKAELKTLSIVTPISKTDGTVLFTAGSAVAANSTITGTGPIVADGVATSSVTITLKDTNNNLVTGIVPTFSATNTGTTNVMTACSSSDTSGISTCTLKSTKAESKILSIATPFIKAGGTVVFNPGFPAVANSNISGTTPVSADGISSSFIEIELRDAFNNPVPGYIPIYNATNTSSGNIYGACSSTNASGISACTLASNVAELKVLQLTSPIAVTGSTVEFSSTLPTSQNSTITGSGPVIADGVATSTVTITLRDFSNNLVTLANGALPAFTATDTGVTNIYSECTNTTAGVYTCTFTSKKAETKTLSITSPVNKNDGTVIFNPGPAAIAFSTITGTSPVVADNVALSTITVTIKDQFNNPISGSTPTFSATNTGTTNTQTACSVTNATGISTCTLKSTTAETKILQILTPVAKTGGNVIFIGGTPVAANSTITGTGPVNPDGTSTSVITITLKDIFNNLSPGVTPTFTATGTGNTYGACSVSSATGISTCTMSSTTGELKTLSIATPFVKAGGTVLFQAGSPVAANSTITGTATPVVANGTSTSTITITLRDASNAPIAGLTPTFSATGTPNTYGICSATSLNGESTCTLSSTVAGIKTLSIESPVLKADGTVTFIAGPAVVANSTILAATPTIADGVDTCEVTVTLKDINNNPVSGIVPTYSMTGTLNTPSACPATDALGQAICTVTSTKAESKTVSLVSPFAKAGNAVEFNTVGINIQVPIELVDRGLLSSTAAVTFNRTRTSFNPLDYESQLNDYYFEVVAENINTTSSYNVSLVNSAGTAISSSVISIPANTSALTRFRVAWTPSLSADNYRVKINATAVAGQVKVHSAKIIIHQTAATATKIYIPLAGGDINGDSGTDTTTAAIASATGSTAYQVLGTATANTTTTGTAYLWNKVSTNYDAISTAADAFTLETVTSTSKASTTATVGLFNKTTGLVVTGAETALAGLTVGMTQKTFANNATNFTDTNAFEIRLKTSQNAQTATLYKAGLWVKLKYLKKAEIYFRLATRRYVPTSPSSLQVPDGRFLWEPSEWTNPSVFFEANGQNPSTSASTISLQDNGASDSATAATTVAGSTVTPGATYGRTRSGALSLGNLSQHTILHSATSGTPYMGAAFIVIQATE